MTPFQQHVAKWRDCQLCPLHSQRTRVVLCRGSLPCDVLFIGEAPGVSEDALGLPFVGPAGKLQDRIIAQAFPDSVRTAFTNVVGCFPSEAKRTDDHSPPPEAIKACSPRLKEIVRMARPNLIVLVGGTARKSVVGQAQFCERGEDGQPPWIAEGQCLEFAEIAHPASILRMPTAGQGLAVRKAVVTLRNAVRKLL